MNWRAAFDAGVDYRTFLEQHGTAVHRDRWQAVYEQGDVSAEELLRALRAWPRGRRSQRRPPWMSRKSHFPASAGATG